MNNTATKIRLQDLMFTIEQRKLSSIEIIQMTWEDVFILPIRKLYFKLHFK